MVAALVLGASAFWRASSSLALSTIHYLIELYLTHDQNLLLKTITLLSNENRIN